MGSPSNDELNRLEKETLKLMLGSAREEDLTLLNYLQPCDILSNTLKVDKEPSQLNNKKAEYMLA